MSEEQIEYNKPVEDKPEKKKDDAPEIPRVEIEASQLREKCQECIDQGMRFITSTCLDREDHFEIYYHFDHKLEEVNLHFTIAKGESIPTVTDIVKCAFLAENEIQDMFGIKVEGLQIDYAGKFLVTDSFEGPPLLKSTKGAIPPPDLKPGGEK
jgi:ech hydrogenase subunit D